MKLRGNRRIAFSLIEMLVALAVITTLVAMLKPSMRLLRLRAHDMQCQNNLRQLFLATQMYSDTWSGYAPASLVFVKPTAAEHAPAPRRIDLVETAWAALDSDSPTAVSYYYRDARLLECPRALSMPSYGLNKEISQDYHYLRNIVHMAIVPLIADAGVHIASTYSDLAYRHSLYANVAMVDGHIDRVRFDPAKAFPNIVYLPGIGQDPNDHSGFDHSDAHAGHNHEVDLGQQVDSQSYEGGIEDLQYDDSDDGRDDEFNENDPCGSSRVKIKFKNRGNKLVKVGWFILNFSRSAYYERVLVDNTVIFTAEDTPERAESGRTFIFTPINVEPSKHFTVTIIGFKKFKQKNKCENIVMRRTNFSVWFSNKSASLIPPAKKWLQ